MDGPVNVIGLRTINFQSSCGALVDRLGKGANGEGGGNGAVLHERGVSRCDDGCNGGATRAIPGKALRRDCLVLSAQRRCRLRGVATANRTTSSMRRSMQPARDACEVRDFRSGIGKSRGPRRGQGVIVHHHVRHRPLPPVAEHTSTLCCWSIEDPPCRSECPWSE